jgi:putative addiction module component (TIGR02574 family)
MGLPRIDVQAMTPEERFTQPQAQELDRRMELLDQGRMPLVPWEEIQAPKPVAPTASP